MKWNSYRHNLSRRWIFIGLLCLLSAIQITPVAAQTSIVTNGTDPSSHLPYFELHNSAWNFVGAAVDSTGSRVAVGLENGDIHIYSNAFELLDTLSGHTLNQRVRDEQHRADELQAKLDALKNIEKTLIDRNQGTNK